MIYHFGECTLDTSLYSVQRGGQSSRLRPKVFRMCLYLLEHRDRVVSREELCSHVWPGRFVSQATLEGVIRLVRQAVGDNGRSQGIILTLHGYGYRFVGSVEEHRTEAMGRAMPPSSPVAGSTEVPALGQAEVEATSVTAVQEQEAIAVDPESEEIAREAAAQNGYAAVRGGAIVLEEWRLARQGSADGWWAMRAGLGLAMVMFMLLGGWWVWGVLGKQAGPTLDKSRIAVLPFIDLSAEADQTYFADGMTEELIAQLAQIHGLTVIARTSVMKYKGTMKDVADIGKELRVGVILQGSVRKIDNQIRISAELIDVASQGHLWSQEFDRELTGVFSLQSDFATRMAQGIKARLATGEKRRAELPAQARQVSF